MAKRRVPEPMMKISVTLPEETVQRLDALAEEFEDYISRSELVAGILDRVLDDEELLEEIFPEEED